MIQTLPDGGAESSVRCHQALLDLAEPGTSGSYLKGTRDLIRLLVSRKDASAEDDEEFFQRLAKQLALSEADLAKLRGQRRGAIWVWNASSGELFWSKEVFRLVGLDADEPELELSAFMERIYPEDRALVEQTCARVSREKCDYELDHRFVRLDGSIRRFHTKGHPILNATGSDVCFVGILEDITERDVATPSIRNVSQQIQTFKGQPSKKDAELAQQKRASGEEPTSESNLKEIVGQSPALQQILKLVSTVSDTCATVLILGETGTEKELVARAIHDASPRRTQAFVKMDCAILAGMLASELFGHERGAFSGALSQKIGGVELADKGTLFLDEVGDISLELQPKLLRFLQEREFKRLGSTQTQQVDTRIVATTQRDLFRMVAEGTFQRDLFYRLSVFPIHVPPLRERREDIPTLVRYFTEKFSRLLNRKVETIPPETLDALVAWDWRGNVRELESVIERGVRLSPGRSLNIRLNDLRQTQLRRDGDQREQ